MPWRRAGGRLRPPPTRGSSSVGPGGRHVLQCCLPVSLADRVISGGHDIPKQPPPETQRQRERPHKKPSAAAEPPGCRAADPAGSPVQGRRCMWVTAAGRRRSRAGRFLLPGGPVGTQRRPGRVTHSQNMRAYAERGRRCAVRGYRETRAWWERRLSCPGCRYGGTLRHRQLRGMSTVS